MNVAAFRHSVEKKKLNKKNIKKGKPAQRKMASKRVYAMKKLEIIFTAISYTMKTEPLFKE